MSESIASDEPTTPQTPAWFYRFVVGYAIYTLIALGLLYVDFFRDLSAPDPLWNSTFYRLLVGFVIVPAGLVIAVLVLRRTQRNVTGLFLVIYAAGVMQVTLRVDSSLQVLSNFLSLGQLGLFLLPLYFPDGDTYPARLGRWVRLHSALGIIVATLYPFYGDTVEIAFGRGDIYYAPNPFLFLAPKLVGVLSVALPVFWLSTVAWIIPSIIIRYRASRGQVRQQIKWFVYGFALYIALFVITLATGTSSGIEEAGRFGLFKPLFIFYEAVIFPFAPFALVGYAILRHKLYDIDLIIRRTLIYSVITAILAAVYVGGVTLLQSVFANVVGGQSTLAIVISTLVIAALFTPVRRRVQSFVDRRFYRQKYDAAHTLDAFAAAMRDEVDLDRIRTDLLTVVDDTLQPESLSLWLAPDALTRRKSL